MVKLLSRNGDAASGIDEGEVADDDGGEVASEDVGEVDGEKWMIENGGKPRQHRQRGSLH